MIKKLGTSYKEKSGDHIMCGFHKPEESFIEG